MNVNILFPQPVADFSLGRAFTEEELRVLLHDSGRRPNGMNETSQDCYVLERKELAELKTFVEQCVEEYTRDVWHVSGDTKFKLTQSWVNYTQPGAAHHKHSHPNSLYSGVLYLQTDPQRDKIHFYRHEFSTLRPKYTEWNQFNADSWWLPTESGTLLLFPSTLEHAVEHVPAGVERCSLAFNVFPTNILGDYAALTEARV